MQAVLVEIQDLQNIVMYFFGIDDFVNLFL